MIVTNGPTSRCYAASSRPQREGGGVLQHAAEIGASDRAGHLKSARDPWASLPISRRNDLHSYRRRFVVPPPSLLMPPGPCPLRERNDSFDSNTGSNGDYKLDPPFMWNSYDRGPTLAQDPCVSASRIVYGLRWRFGPSRRLLVQHASWAPSLRERQRTPV